MLTGLMGACQLSLCQEPQTKPSFGQLSLELGRCVQTGWTAPPRVAVGPLKATSTAFSKLEAAPKAREGCFCRNLRPESHSGPLWPLV